MTLQRNLPFFTLTYGNVAWGTSLQDHDISLVKTNASGPPLAGKEVYPLGKPWQQQNEDKLESKEAATATMWNWGGGRNQLSLVPEIPKIRVSTVAVVY